MENYLSIGEVAKIRNIDVQSLRYYEKLGILIPAYTNPQTGYRYYSMEQIMILDTIILCIDLGIPLKRLKEYVDSSGQLEFERLLKDGKVIAEEKIKKIHAGLHASFPHGIISTYEDGKYLSSKMFMEVARSESEAVEMLNSGNYICYQEPREIHSDPTEIFPENLFEGKKIEVVVSSMSPNTYKYNEVIMEFQMLT